jgi:HlyD family secretion protein
MTNGKKNSWWKWLFVFLLLGGAAGGGYYWYQQRQNGENDSPYQTAVVTRGDITQVVTATGQLNPVLNVTVGSQISGIIQKLFVDFNSPVTNNQIIAQIDPATYKANLQQANGDLANATAQLELARANAGRSKELLESRLISPSDYDQTIALLHQAEAQIMIKSATVQRAQTDLSRCTIYAPVDGIVIDRKVDVGQTVAAGFSAPTLFIIANDLKEMQIDANVAEADIGLISTNLSVTFNVDAYPYRTFHGKVIQVRNAPITVQNVVTYDTVIKVNNDELKLKPGMTANVSIIIADHKNVLRAPNAAFRVKLPKDKDANKTPELTDPSRPDQPPRDPVSKRRRGIPRDDQPVVRTLYVLVNSAPKSVKIKTGISDGAYTELYDGLKENDEIITFVKNTDKSGDSQTSSTPFGSGRRHF